MTAQASRMRLATFLREVQCSIRISEMAGTDDVARQPPAGGKMEYFQPPRMFSDSRKLHSLPATSSSEQIASQVGAWRKVTLPSVSRRATGSLNAIQPVPPPRVV